MASRQLPSIYIASSHSLSMWVIISYIPLLIRMDFIGWRCIGLFNWLLMNHHHPISPPSSYRKSLPHLLWSEATTLILSGRRVGFRLVIHTKASTKSAIYNQTIIFLWWIKPISGWGDHGKLLSIKFPFVFFLKMLVSLSDVFDLHSQ